MVENTVNDMRQVNAGLDNDHEFSEREYELLKSFKKECDFFLDNMHHAILEDLDTDLY